jgi:hypothetical protein
MVAACNASISRRRAMPNTRKAALTEHPDSMLVSLAYACQANEGNRKETYQRCSGREGDRGRRIAPS